MNNRIKWYSIIGLATVMSIFGSIGFVAAETELQPLELVFIRCVFGAFFLGCLWVVKGGPRNEKWSFNEGIKVLIGGVILVLNWIFLFLAFENLPVTLTVSIYYLAPVVVLLLGSFFFREKLTRLSVLSIFLCFTGTIMIMGYDHSLSSFLSSGFLWALLAALFYAILTLIGKSISSLSAYATSFIQISIGMLLLSPFVHYDKFLHLSLTNWIAVFIMGIVHTGIVYLLFFASIRHLSSSVTSALLFLDPAVAISLDMLMTNFRATPLQTFGLVLTYGGIGCVLLSPFLKTLIQRATIKEK
ncbi:DMT family transporter [Bacillus carboniphilus]|uniref:DMT family transporter n=1 Tax=Bacillus carboniphilus TaxID=86663 RepID=A0ABY9JU10_9BACI|nr:DMT family transporter [Bacillus carboniphilus]WLR42852.1 DMT family transporter [Bacillus carboniphilus]